MKKNVPQVTLNLLETPIKKEKRVELLRKSVGNSSTSAIKLRISQGEFREKYYKIKPKLIEDFFVIGADLTHRKDVNTKEMHLPSKILYMFSGNQEC
jgi:hypothetical protein